MMRNGIVLTRNVPAHVWYTYVTTALDSGTERYTFIRHVGDTTFTETLSIPIPLFRISNPVDGDTIGPFYPHHDTVIYTPAGALELQSGYESGGNSTLVSDDQPDNGRYLIGSNWNKLPREGGMFHLIRHLVNNSAAHGAFRSMQYDIYQVSKRIRLFAQ